MNKNIKLVLFIFFLCLLFLNNTSFGATSYNQINEVLNSYGYSDMPVNSNVTSALSQNCAVFFTHYNSNNEPTRVTILYDKYGFFPVYLEKTGSGTSTSYRIRSTTNTGWLYFHYYNINTATKELTYGGSLGTANYPIMTSYSNYSSSISVDEFNTYAFQKKVLNNSLIYLPSNQGLYFNSPSGIDIYYVWDGKWDGTQNGTEMDIYGGSFTFSGQYLYYYYESGLNEPIDLTIEMNSYYPSSLKNLSENTVPENNGDKYDLIYAGTKWGYSYYYVRLYDLIEKCRDGMISRMTAVASDINSSGEISNVTMCTSEFFGVNKWISNTYKVRNLLDYINIQDDTIYPEGGTDLPGSGDSINITINGGLTSGDIAGLNNSLNNLNTTIGNLGNILSGEAIKDAQVEGNKDYWGNENDLNQEEFETQIETELNITMDIMSGEISQNQIFESLQGAENGFLNFFKEKQNEGFYDLAFSWPDIKYMDSTLIPAGGFNISEMCREIPELGQLQSLIRVIFNFSVAVALIKQIYNLILSTLGIDNPYLYEESDMEMETFNDLDAGTTYVTYSGTTTDGHRYRIRSNHTKIKKNNRIGF